MTKHRKGYLYKRNGIYQLEYFVNGKRFKQSLKVGTKAEAEKKRDKIMKPLEVADEAEALSSVKSRLDARKSLLKEYDLERNPPIALEQAWNYYLKSKNRPDTGDKTLRHYESYFKRLLSWLTEENPEIVFLKDITPQVAAEFMDCIQSKFAPRTFNGYLTFLRHMFDVLEDSARIEVNPWSKNFIRKKKLKGKQISRRELTMQELRDIIEPTSGEFRLLLAIGIFTGLRLGDAATLKWNEVDLTRGLIRRIPRKTAHTSGKVVKIGIPRVLYAMLCETPSKKRTKYVLPTIAADYEKDSSAMAKRIQKHFEACGIETQIKKKGKRAATVVGFHSLRHTYVSIHAEAGTPQAIIRDLVGHGNVAMTEHYEHISDEAAIRHAKALPSIIDVDSGEDSPRVCENQIDLCISRLKSMNGKNWRSIRDSVMKELQACCETVA